MAMIMNPTATVFYEVVDLNGTDHRTGEISVEVIGENPVSVLLPDAPLLPNHEYTIRVAAVSPEPEANGATSPWTEYQPIVLAQQQIAGIEIDPNPNPAYLIALSWSYTLPTDALIPAVDLEISVNNGSWFAVDYDPALPSIAIANKPFNQLTASAYLSQPLTVKARIRTPPNDPNWVLSNEVLLPRTATPLFSVSWSNALSGVGQGYWMPSIYYVPASGVIATFSAAIDNGPPFEVIGEWPPAAQPIANWLSQTTETVRDNAPHSIQWVLTETDSATQQTQQYRGPVITRVIEPMPVVPAPLLKALNLDERGIIVAELIKIKLINVTLRAELWINGVSVQTKTGLATETSRFIFQTAPFAPGWTTAEVALTAEIPALGLSSAVTRQLKALFRKPLVPLNPTAVNATLMRQADAVYPDQVHLVWTANTLVQIVAVVASRRFVLGYADSTDAELMLEDTRSVLPKTGELTPVYFGVRAYSLLAGVSDTILSASPLLIQMLPPDDLIEPPQGPQFTHSAFVAEVATETSVTFTVADFILRTALTGIKAVIAKGGSVELSYFGQFIADWSKNERNAKFVIHKAFALGTQQGVVLP